ncbi:ferrous iron transport protein A [Rothia nasimurium]|uniref:Ferrous iron transport protein A n=1 Tax=Rothia nasimurium TaxID=85336 RepID=A0A4Y9F5I3_9MICC|nr:FeoA family protein [Rothia nasimurium]MBF0808060.1 ferrous iron transport protein A [Rothia nasimurium]TFU22639.1 ferrous iron transport protein A [Rothia nasimurium]
MTLLAQRESAPVYAAGSTLASAHPQQIFTVEGFCDSADPTVIQRLHDLGFRVGSEIKCLRRAPLGSPLMFRVCDTDICLRKQQAALVKVG